MKSIFTRTSVRKYLPKEVEQEKILEILKAGMAAPSAGNQQPWEFYVVKDKNKLKELSEVSPYANFTKSAGVAFVVCYRDNTTHYQNYAVQDCSAVTQNMLLAIDHLGLGGVWLGIAPIVERMGVVREILDLPSHLHAFSIISCGYEDGNQAPKDKFDETRIHYI